MERGTLIQTIKDELNRQSQADRMDTPYLYNEAGDKVGIDGYLDIGELADAMLKVMA